MMKKKLLTLTLAFSMIISTSVSAIPAEKNTYDEAKEKQLVESKMEYLANNPKQLVRDKEPVSKSKTNSALRSAVSGSYPTRNGAILVTTSKKDSGLPNGTGHAGIVYSGFGTIESFPDGGVQRRVNNWADRYDVVYGLTVDDTKASEDETAASWCNSQVGKGYNYNFLKTSTRSKFYCSQLVWAAYKDNFDIDLDDDGGIIYPIDLVNSGNTQIIYAKK